MHIGSRSRYFLAFCGRPASSFRAARKPSSAVSFLDMAGLAEIRATLADGPVAFAPRSGAESRNGRSGGPRTAGLQEFRVTSCLKQTVLRVRAASVDALARILQTLHIVAEREPTTGEMGGLADEGLNAFFLVAIAPPGNMSQPVRGASSSQSRVGIYEGPCVSSSFDVIILVDMCLC